MRNHLKKLTKTNQIFSKLFFAVIFGLLFISYCMLKKCILGVYGVYTYATITSKDFSHKQARRITSPYKLFYKFSTIAEDKITYECSKGVSSSRYNILKIGDSIEVVYLPLYPALNDIQIPLSK